MAAPTCGGAKELGDDRGSRVGFTAIVLNGGDFTLAFVLRLSLLY